MRQLDNPQQAPRCCFACGRTPMSARPLAWVDTRKTFETGPAGLVVGGKRVSGPEGRVYLCQTCIEDAGKEIGLVTEERVQRAEADARQARALANAYRSRFEALAQAISAGELEREADFLAQVEAIPEAPAEATVGAP